MRDIFFFVRLSEVSPVVKEKVVTLCAVLYLQEENGSIVLAKILCSTAFPRHQESLKER